MKLLGAAIATLVCAIIAILPELAMYATWSLINPESDAARIVLVIAFWACGAGLCVFFAVMAFMLWAALIQTILK